MIVAESNALQSQGSSSNIFYWYKTPSQQSSIVNTTVVPQDVMAMCTSLLTAEKTRSDKTIRDTLPLSHEVQRGLLCILKSLSERTLGVAGSRLSSRLGQRFMSKWLYVQNQPFISLS